MGSDPNDAADIGAAPSTIDGPAGPSGAGAPATAIPMSPVDHDLLVRTVLAEGGSSPDSMGAVANSIRNRLLMGSKGGFSDTPSGVVLQKGQYEVWQDGSANRVNSSSGQYAVGSRIVDAVMAGQAPDNTGGATHFYSPSGQAARAGDGRRLVPAWATNPTASVGGNVYFAPNGRVGQGGVAPVNDGSNLSDDDIAGMLSGQGTASETGVQPGTATATPIASRAAPPGLPSQVMLPGVYVVAEPVGDAPMAGTICTNWRHAAGAPDLRCDGCGVR